jgi:hypothetical protein
MNTLTRLTAALVAVNPNIVGVSGTGPADAGYTWAVGYAPSGGEITAVNAALAAFDWSAGAQTTWENLQDRAGAIVALGLTDREHKLLRAAFDVTRDEVNVLRAWLAAFKTEVAAATTLADLKTRVATLPATPARTLAQLKTAITNRVNDGTVDT